MSLHITCCSQLCVTRQCSRSDAINGSPDAQVVLELAKQQSLVCGDGGLLARSPPELPPETGAESPNPDTLKPAGTYSEEELDVLALAYTGIKVLYAMGALA